MADMDAAVAVLTNGGSMRDAAQASGIGKSAFYARAKSEPLATRISEARGRSGHRARAKARRAQGPVKEFAQTPTPPAGVTPEVVTAELVADTNDIFGDDAVKQHVQLLRRLANGGPDIDPKVQAEALKGLTVAILAPVTAERIRTPPPEEVSGAPARVVLALPPNARVPKD